MRRTFVSEVLTQDTNWTLNMKRLFLSCMFVGVIAQVASAQAPAQVVQATVTMASELARPNSVIRAAVVAHVIPGYHINDHHPSLDYLIPTEVKLEPSKDVTVQDITYPKGEAQKFAFSDSPLSVYQGSVRIDVGFQVERGAPPGDYQIKGRFAYQACNDHACLPPASVPLTFSFKVIRRGRR
jgi:DsbC/DsbD-like thiol-disulfide interchange protein